LNTGLPTKSYLDPVPAGTMRPPESSEHLRAQITDWHRRHHQTNGRCGPRRRANDALEKDPSDWVSGDDPITPSQKSYLDTLARQAGEELPADMTKAEASQHIDRLRNQSGQEG
jgi:hypothetical protein